MYPKNIKNLVIESIGYLVFDKHKPLMSYNDIYKYADEKYHLCWSKSRIREIVIELEKRGILVKYTMKIPRGRPIKKFSIDPLIKNSTLITKDSIISYISQLSIK